jgi:hypothetical protein
MNNRTPVAGAVPGGAGVAASVVRGAAGVTAGVVLGAARVVAAAGSTELVVAAGL